MHKVFQIFLVALIAFSLVGCANIQNDSTRTTTEATLVGGGVGAGVGAIIGGLIGGRQGALIGAGIGGGVGLLGGLITGKHIASKKSEYASQESWLAACIAQTQEVNTALIAYNGQLKTEVAALEKKSAQLAADYKKQTVQKNQLTAQAKEVKNLQENLVKEIALAENEVVEQNKVLADAKANNNKKEAQALDKEIAQMETQIAQMKAQNQQLAAISARLAV